MLQFVANDRWSPTNQNVDAKYPRLTRKTSLNNTIGIVAGVTKELALQNINILDISQTILDGIFAMILICDMEKAKGTLKDVQDALGMLGKELGVDAVSYTHLEQIFPVFSMVEILLYLVSMGTALSFCFVMIVT